MFSQSVRVSIKYTASEYLEVEPAVERVKDKESGERGGVLFSTGVMDIATLSPFTWPVWEYLLRV